MDKKEIPIGGFPPVKYCIDKDKIITDIDSKKKRLFETKSNKDINIREILSSSKKKPIINLSTKKEDIEEVETVF